MRRAIIVIALIAVLTRASDGRAQKYEASGVGTMPCETWTAVRPDHLAHRVELEQWVLGFFSGVGFAGAGNPLSERDAKAIWAWIDNYCQAHPHDHIAEAAAALDFELDKPASR